MTILFENESGRELPFDAEALANRVILHSLDYEQCPYEAEVSMIITTNDEIQRMNSEHRGIDRATDVLSFPLVDYVRPGDFSHLEEEEDCFDPDSGELLLGDIVISVDKVYEQAESYGHTPEREFAFLTAHSMLHLMGYDHMVPEEAEVMEARQAEILAQLGINR